MYKRFCKLAYDTIFEIIKEELIETISVTKYNMLTSFEYSVTIYFKNDYRYRIVLGREYFNLDDESIKDYLICELTTRMHMMEESKMYLKESTNE